MPGCPGRVQKKGISFGAPAFLITVPRSSAGLLGWLTARLFSFRNRKSVAAAKVVHVLQASLIMNKNSNLDYRM
ncbi:hypothetical protein CHUAL_000522 [Chamberlinius hualienensis]